MLRVMEREIKVLKEISEEKEREGGTMKNRIIEL